MGTFHAGLAATGAMGDDDEEDEDFEASDEESDDDEGSDSEGDAEMVDEDEVGDPCKPQIRKAVRGNMISCTR